MKVDFIYGKKRTSCEASVGDGVLETAIKAKINPPYSCFEGMCSACAAQCTPGSCEMPADSSLSEAELKEGKILTCQARFKDSAGVIEINYDAI